MKPNKFDQVVVLGREKCPFCEEAKRFLKAREIVFTYMDINEHPSVKEMMLRGGFRTVPQIFSDGSLIGGYEDLRKALLDA